MLDRARVAAARRRFERSVDARYERQSYELPIPVPPGTFDEAALDGIAEAFHDRHRQTYGHDNRAEPVQIVSIRLTAIGSIPPIPIRARTPGDGADPGKERRTLWFRGREGADAAVYDRNRMPAGFSASGPAVIESLESTILVPPDWRARVTEDGFVVLTRREDTTQ
jgi:N-methylhydantoinase A